MTITLRPDQEQVLRRAIHSGLAQTPDEALARAFQLLAEQLPADSRASGQVVEATQRLSRFGKEHGLSLGGMTVKELINASRP